MFIDQKTPSPAPLISEQATAPKPLIGRKEFILIASIAAVIVLAAAGWWWWTQRSQPTPQPVVQVQPQTNPALPGTLNPVPDQNVNNQTPSNIKGENITFGAFYKSETSPVDIKISGVPLPLNVKSQVSNYYDTARKVNLDPIVANLNQDGFATLDNPFTKSANDFFGTYAELKQRSMPIVISSDFLLYYYQNSLKQIYKDIESSYFYESLWTITKAMYDRANTRYQDRHEKLGVNSDSLLEAERLEAAYFATGLMLLQPQTNQINATEDINNVKNFKPSEASKYDFTLPNYLSDDVNAEVALIRQANQQIKSPALLYIRDYNEFKIPPEYVTTAKLTNFYMASRWYSSLFPLYYKEGSCPSCLLDKEDWIINQSAAHLIASDLSSDQALKNEWAKIYKVISYFSGLRSELTYLHFDTIRQQVYKDMTLDNLLGSGVFDRLIKMRDELAKLPFNQAEGGYPRTAATRPFIGMRMLQSFYWPNRSFYDQLTFSVVGNHKQPTINGHPASYLSSCQNRSGIFRCRGIGFDLLNPVLTTIPGSKFLVDNMNYEHYASQSALIKAQLQKFDSTAWHSNNFWSTLSITTSYINAHVATLSYTSTEHWLERKISTGLAMLTNLSLPADTWTVPHTQTTSGLTLTDTDISLNYIEPDLDVANELVANSKMLFRTLIGLDVVKDNDPQFSELVGKVSKSRDIIVKELENKDLNNDEYQFISDFSGQYSLDIGASKMNTVLFTDPTTGLQYVLKQNIAPLKLLFIIYNKAGKRVLASGPIFSYKEQ